MLTLSRRKYFSMTSESQNKVTFFCLWKGFLNFCDLFSLNQSTLITTYLRSYMDNFSP